MRAKKVVSILLAAAVLGLVVACAGEPVISDIGTDKVKVVGNGARPEQIMSKAADGCALYKKKPVSISFRCADQYCIQKEYLFACKDES